MALVRVLSPTYEGDEEGGGVMRREEQEAVNASFVRESLDDDDVVTAEIIGAEEGNGRAAQNESTS